MKWAFCSGAPAEYAALLEGATLGTAKDYGSHILLSVEPYYLLVLGGGSERVLYHLSESTLPKKRQLLSPGDRVFHDQRAGHLGRGHRLPTGCPVPGAPTPREAGHGPEQQGESGALRSHVRDLRPWSRGDATTSTSYAGSAGLAG